MRYKVDNFRGYESSGWIEINKLNVFLGKNSSGKSSLVRLLPLIKQSIENKKNEPILWYTPDYVDFGGFNETLKEDASSNSITFSFDFLLPFQYLTSKLEKNDSFVDVVSNNLITTNVSSDKREDSPMFDYVVSLDSIKFEINLTVTDNSLSKLVIKFNNYHYVFKYSKDMEILEIIGMYDNDSKIQLENDSFSITNHVLIPSFKIVEEKNYEDNELDVVKSIANNKNDLNHFVQGKLASIFNKNKLNETQVQMLKTFVPFDFETQIKFLNTVFEYQDNKKVSKRTKYLKEILILSNFSYLPLIIGSIEDYLEDYFNMMTYIKPVRATLQRYYRLQGIAVSDVTPSGSNIPMILANMSLEELNAFQGWTAEHFNILIDKHVENGHVSILIKDMGTDEVYRNIVDLGFGYSQILPLIFSIWLQIYRKNRDLTRKRFEQDLPHTIIIEQPELHLHPAMQAEFIDICSKIINQKSSNRKEINFIFETHSETIINRLSHLIEEGKIDNQNISLFIVESDDKSSKVIKSTFDEEGQLTKWPIGFFSPGAGI